MKQPNVPALIRVLRELHAKGQIIVAASVVAERLWPDARHDNTQGQMFNLASPVAGRMLRKCKAVIEVAPRRWEIIPERLDEYEQESEPK